MYLHNSSNCCLRKLLIGSSKTMMETSTSNTLSLESVACQDVWSVVRLDRLRELVSVVTAHTRRLSSWFLAKKKLELANLAKANANRITVIFEESLEIIEIAQNKRINTPLNSTGNSYAFDSTTIDSASTFS